MHFKFFFKILTLLISLQISSFVCAEQIWIDVRSAEENKVNNIAGDVRITHVEIVEGVSTFITDKNTEIYLYCRSGRRANVAMSALNNVGYNNVTNVGSIDNARKVRGLSK